MKKSVRTTISIPAALKTRMDELCDGVNWSAVAAQAFEAKVAEAIARRGAKDMDDVISRLRASKAKTDDKVKAKGIETGRNWAMHHAEHSELQNLERFTEYPWDSSCSWEANLEDNGDPNAAFGPSHFIVETIKGEDCDRQDSNSFWRDEVGEDCDDARYEDAFLVGFVEGAMQVWDEVKGEL